MNYRQPICKFKNLFLCTLIKYIHITQFYRRPRLSVMDEYFSRCNALKKAIKYVPESPPRSRKLKTKQNFDAAAGNGEAVIREINQIYNASYNAELRQELLGPPDESGSASLRKRVNVPAANVEGSKEMGQALKYYGDVQERIAEDMLSLTRSLREQTETANRIIRRDTEVVSTSSNLSDRNLSSLTREAEKLSDHSKRAWKCWMWIMIGLVMMIFICKYKTILHHFYLLTDCFFPSYGYVYEDNEKESIIWPSTSNRINQTK